MHMTAACCLPACCCPAAIYMLMLLYLFVGVALASDKFMNAIEVGFSAAVPNTCSIFFLEANLIIIIIMLPI
jgi:hypothetical protein